MRIDLLELFDFEGVVEQAFKNCNLFERSPQTVTSQVSTGESKSLYLTRPRTVAFSKEGAGRHLLELFDFERVVEQALARLLLRYIYIYTHICLYIYKYISIYLSIYLSIYIYIYIYIYTYIHSYI